MAGRPPGSNAQLVKEKKLLEKEIDLLKRQLRERPQAQVTNKRVYADKPIQEFTPRTKQNFIEANRKDIKNLLMFADPTKRRQQSTLWQSVWDIARNNFEDWTIQNTGNRWLVKSCGLKKRKVQDGNRMVDMPSEDFVELEFVHKGYLRYMLNDHGHNVIDAGPPPTVDIIMTVRIHRFEVEDE